MSYTLFTASRNYSSWSLRPWLLMKGFGIAFEDRIATALGVTADEIAAKPTPGFES